MLHAPIANSYWLLEGQLLAGEYPGANDDERAREKLKAMLAAGIRSFIDLTALDDPLEPYELILKQVAANSGVEVNYSRMPIGDMSVPSHDLMRDILRTIDVEIAAGRRVYVHCWGGIGRTGTVAGCWLIQHGHDCDDVLRRIKELRAWTPHASVESPQTEDQREFVRSWRSDK
jgi:protein-tyrosine phosphatase